MAAPRSRPERATGWPAYLSPFPVQLGLAVPAGVVSALVALGLLATIRGVTWIFYSLLGAHLAVLGRWYVVIILVIGALLYSPLTRLIVPRPQVHGIPEVIYAERLYEGRIRFPNLLLDIISAVISIGAGAPMGQEGPVAQAGSGVASAAGQALRLPDEVTRTLVACGAAGAVAATFDAPLAGTFFAVEVVLRRLSPASFVAILVSAVTGNLTARSLFGVTPPFPAAPFVWHSPVQVLLFAVLGGLAGAAGVLTVVALQRAIDLFDRWSIPFYARAFLGASLVGALAAVIPREGNSLPSAILGVGGPVVRTMVQGHQVALTVLLLLGIAKLVAFWLSVGSGSAGGVLGPCLFGGVMLGTVFAHLVGGFPIDAGHGQTAYAVVGMVTLYAAAAEAPLMAMALSFELTGQPDMLAPAVLAVAVAYALARRFEHHTIYTIHLTKEDQIEAGIARPSSQPHPLH